MTRVGSEIEVAPSASGMVLLAFQDQIIKDIRIRESLPNATENEIESFSNGLKEVVSKGFASIKSKQYEGLHAISFPILDMNGNAVAALTVPMLARIDGTNQFTHKQVEEILRESVENLSQKIAISIRNIEK
jgi:DNA-binding IclR family transcriptional regulator